jgi:hypothetical protein
MQRLARIALMPLALLMALSGSAIATADEAPARSYPTYTMRLNPDAPSVVAGGSTTITITFKAPYSLYGHPVDLSVVDLPAGITASFAPQTPRIGGTATLSLITSVGFPKSSVALTVSAIVNVTGGDPIGTTTPLTLTVTG